MSLLSKASILALGAMSCTATLFAANAPRNLVPDNLIICAPASGCTSETLFGRSYKVMVTPRFTVKVSLSRQGSYTRADVSVANNTGYAMNLSPQDFRVEVVAPKPKVLVYIAPSELKHVPPPPAVPVLDMAADDASTAGDAVKDGAGSIEQIGLATKRKALRDAAESAAAQRDLAMEPLPPNVVTRGRVFFERDRRAQQVNLVLPIAGAVFEFPFNLEH